MKTRSLLLPLSLLAASGCGLLLGLGDYKDAPSSTGSGGASSSSSGATSTSSSTSTSTSTSTSSSTSSSGKGGAGGAGGMPENCQNVATPFDILSASDVGGELLDDKSLQLAFDSANNNGYVVVVGENSGNIYQAVVTDHIGNPIQRTVTYKPPTPNGGTHVARGAVNKMANAWFGWHDHDLMRWDFPLDGSAASAVPLTNLSCDSTQSIRNAAFAFDQNGAMIYVVTTVDNPQTTATLCYGTGLGGVAGQLGTGPFNPSSTDLLAESILATSTGYLIRSGSDGPGNVYFAWGSTPAELSVRHQFLLSKKMSEPTAVFAEIIMPKNAGAVLFTAKLTNPQIVPATLYTGEVPVAQFGDLDNSAMGKIPPPELAQGITLANPGDVALLSRPVFDATRIFTAGQAYTADSVRLFVFTRVGSLVLPNYSVYKPPMGASVLGGGTAFVGAQLLVAWVEKSADNPPKFSVRGQFVACN